MASDNGYNICLCAFRVGSIAPNGNQKVHVDDLKNVEDQITLNTKCYILITDKAR